MRPALLGMVAGFGMALALGRVLAGLLYGVTSADPAVFAAVSAMLVGTSATACGIPAWRASRMSR